MRIDGVIATSHRNPSCIAAAIQVDNLSAMKTDSTGDTVRTTITGTKLRSIIASVDDYLMNLSIADEACRYRQDRPDTKDNRYRTGTDNDNVETEPIEVR